MKKRGRKPKVEIVPGVTKFGKLLVLGQRVDKTVKCRASQFVCDCRCECSRECTVVTATLRDGRTKSCGCAREAYWVKMRTHGARGKKAYRVWRGIISVCDSPAHPSYPWYGAAGIGYPDAWKTYEGFWVDIKPLLPADAEDIPDNWLLLRKNKKISYSTNNVEFRSR